MPAEDYGTSIIKPSAGNPDWFPNETKFIETYEKTETGKSGKNVFVIRRKNSAYNRGMSGDIFDASKDDFGLGPDCNIF